MLSLKKYQKKIFAIYGMGMTGFSTAEALQNSGASIFCWDDNKKIRKKIKSLKFPLNKFWQNKEIFDFILLSPGIDIEKCKLKNYLKKNSKKIITDLDLFFESCKNSTIISITGTNGKSTTCKIIEKILKMAKYNVKIVGNIGNPILSSGPVNKKCIYILEASSYQLQYSKIFQSKHAAILNVSPDHLERHKSIKNYIKVKSKIFYAQRNLDFSYINSNNKFSKNIKAIFKSKKIKSKLILIKKSDCRFILKKINNRYFNSSGNIENLAFAHRIARNFNISNKIIVKALNEFKGLSHRQEIVFSDKNLLCINDSKATSFQASLQSLLSHSKIYWIVGGVPKYLDHINLKNVKNKILKAYIVGKKTSFFKKEIGNQVPYKVSKSIKNAINDIFVDLKLDKNLKKTILLSPAGASFDQFENFEERGNYFKNLLIRKLNQR
jgi:UDP-N-acetylmuramoylalanine--D-glutamate ligase